MRVEERYASVGDVPDHVREHYETLDDGSAQLIVDGERTLEAIGDRIFSLMNEEDIEEYAARREAQLREEMQALLAEAEEHRRQIAASEERNREWCLREAIRAAAEEARLAPTAIADAALLAQQQCQVDSDGRVTGPIGEPIEAWLAETIEARPHWRARQRRAGERTVRKIFT